MPLWTKNVLVPSWSRGENKKGFENEEVIERLANLIKNLIQKDVNLDNRQ